MSRFLSSVSVFAVVASAVTLLAGCKGDAPRGEILLAYSGDCQAYLEPCG